MRSRFPSQRRQKKRKIAGEQIEKLMDLALKGRSEDPSLSQRHAQIAWNLSTRFNVRLGPKRLLFCRHCKAFIVPPNGARYRLSRRRHGLNITCLSCGKIYRKLFLKG